MATLKAQGLLFPHTARSLPLTFRAFRLLLLLGALLTWFSLMPTWAQAFTHTQITNSTAGNNFEPSINSDGTRIAFYSDRDLTPGSNPDGNREIFLWTSGSGFTQITNTTVGANFSPSINADGTRIAFISTSDLTGGNADLNQEIFLWTQGSGITQITNTTVGFNGEPSINSDGTRIAFDSDRDLTPGSPGNADLNQEIFLWTQGSGFTQITNSTGSANLEPSINSDGTRIAFTDGSLARIFLWTQGSGITQITNTTGGFNRFPSINSDGTRIAFVSDRDLTGGNADGNSEIFLWTQGSGFTQITNSTGGSGSFASSSPSINSDGTRIAFVSNRDLTPGSNPDGNQEIFLVSVPRVDLTVSGSGPGPTLINPVSVQYRVQGCGGQEMFLVLNAPAMGIPWSYLNTSGAWVLLPTPLSLITPWMSSGPPDGTYSLFNGTAPAGTYELYLGCDFVNNGTLNIDAGGNVNGVYDHRVVTVP